MVTEIKSEKSRHLLFQGTNKRHYLYVTSDLSHNTEENVQFNKITRFWDTIWDTQKGGGKNIKTILIIQGLGYYLYSFSSFKSN